ncbi:MAG: oxaloacetate decarboxylase alpha subunit, partial [Halioglobus sp.]
ASEQSIHLSAADNEVDDVLTYALFPQIGLKFLTNRGNPDAFEPVPGTEPQPQLAPAASAVDGEEVYTVTVDGHSYVVQVANGGDISAIAPSSAATAQRSPSAASTPTTAAAPLKAPLAGNIFNVNVAVGDSVESGDIIVILEAMKMETEVRATTGGTVISVNVKVGDSVSVGDTLISVG